MARNKIDPEVARKAYAHAIKTLKANHPAEFAALVDEGYAQQGVESPAKRRDRVAAEAAEAAKARREVREAKAQRKIDEARALLVAAGLQVVEPVSVDEEFAGLAESIESVVTADQTA